MAEIRGRCRGDMARYGRGDGLHLETWGRCSGYIREIRGRYRGDMARYGRGDGLHRRELRLEVEPLGAHRSELGVDAAELALRGGEHTLRLGRARVQLLGLG